jgi:hypothetical protein
MPTLTEPKGKVGRPRECNCGICKKCKRREKKRKYRERRNDRLQQEYGIKEI